MQPGNTGKASSGAPFRPPPAVIWNNMVDAGQAFASSKLDVGTPPPIRPRETDIIKIKNTSGADRRRGEILKIDGKATTDVTDEHIWLLGVEPTVDCYFGILRYPLLNGQIADLQVSGCRIALVDMVSTSHKRAKAIDASYVLESGEDGPIEILYAPSGTGEKECVVRFGGAGSLALLDALVTTCIGDGFYTVQLADMAAMTVPGSGQCDPCTSDCDTPTTSFPRTLPVGSGVSVTAYDSRKLPMEIGGHCVIADMGDTETPGGDPIYRVIVPARRVRSFNIEDWECCPETGILRVSCRTVYGEFHICEAQTAICPEYAVASASSSAFSGTAAITDGP